MNGESILKDIYHLAHLEWVPGSDGFAFLPPGPIVRRAVILAELKEFSSQAVPGRLASILCLHT